MTLLVVLLVVPLAAFFMMGVYSARQTPPSANIDQSFACDDSPNCVCSELVQMPSQAIEPLSFNGQLKDGQNLQQAIVDAIISTGGQIVDARPGVVRATYTSNIFSFVDDVAIKINEAQGYADIISQSRVGHSDFGANRKRVEKIRAALRAN